MKKINFKDEYLINDLGRIELIDNIIDKINIDNNNVVKLNFRQCFIDYPATSKIIDNILMQMDILKDKKEILIEIDYYLPENNLLNLLLVGSKYFGFEENKELKLEDLKKTINKTLQKNKITIEINMVDRKGNTLKELVYGK
jgi:hypothetical protein